MFNARRRRSRVTDTVLVRTVAVKVLTPALLADPDFAARFRIEARMLAVVHGPGIADVFDCGECTLPDGERVLYLVMEYVDGQPLSQLLAEQGHLEPARVMSIIAQAARAPQAAPRMPAA